MEEKLPLTTRKEEGTEGSRRLPRLLPELRSERGVLGVQGSRGALPTFTCCAPMSSQAVGPDKVQEQLSSKA